MHLVTSSLFLPSLCAHLQPTSQKRLLVAYLAACLAAYVARGRPALDLRGFFSRPFGPVAAPGPRPTPHKSALHPRFRMPVEGSDGGSSGDGAAWADGDDQEAPEELHPNAWLALAQSALFHPEAHVTKCVRALAHDARLYGSLPRRGFAHLGVGALGLDGLDGAEWIDGSLFARAAEATMGRVGWTREGEEARFWDRL